MPVCIPDALPAAKVLASENIFVMTRQRSTHQDIRPLHIAVLNLMPTKEATETQLLRLIGNTPLQVHVTLLRTATYESQHTAHRHLSTFYRTFEEVRGEKFDALIITGAPVEQMEFSEVGYWRELERVMAWAKENVFSTLFICWAAQAGLNYFYGIRKRVLKEKMFGVFPHRVLDRSCKLVRGFDDEFFIPVSRHTAVDEAAVYASNRLRVVAASEESGIGLIVSDDERFVFATGHSEYDAGTLAAEYFRDVNRGLPIAVPRHYFPDDDPARPPVVRWRSHANLLFQNWLNYYVYQETPYNQIVAGE
ncbi:MAG TPA: homoserine O-succinyltransferase [Candidatus Faecivicinus avistercoris]|nr:homoserine O-succinyltransferase [Candidatus Faecivicinus avistercoris]